MPKLPEAIIAAFNALGGERNIKEIRDWIYERYGDRWKDIGTSMADMVPVSHGRSHSSQINANYRVLNKVSRGRYCLIKTESNLKDFKIVKNNRGISIEELDKEPKEYNQPLNKSNYYINTPNDKILEVYTSKRLPYEPKGWQLELRNTIRGHLKQLRGDDVVLYALYKSMDPSFFDVENVLFYNVGAAAFSHVNIKTLQFERAYEHPLTLNDQYYEHYQSYEIDQDERHSEYWIKKRTLAIWMNVSIPKLSSEIKPHTIWHAMKTGTVKILDRSNSELYGLEVTIKAPVYTQVKLVSIIKPLLDGIISAFHHHDLSDVDEVVYRLKEYINLPQKQIEQYLLDTGTSILGPRNLIQPYRDGVKWNPEDDAFQFLKITIEPQNHHDNWSIDGEIYTIRDKDKKVLDTYKKLT